MAPQERHRRGNAEEPGWLKRHLVWILIAKIGLLVLLYAFFFSPSSRPVVDSDAVGRRMNTPSR